MSYESVGTFFGSFFSKKTSFAPVILKLAKLDGQPEIFHSIQGEGRSLGRPSVFVRTSLCNLHCAWCDTDYTWNWERTRFRHENDATEGYQKFKKTDWLIEISTDEAAEKALAFGCRNIILTGGEPMLQQPALVDLIEKMRSKRPDLTFEIETNGTLAPSPALEEMIDQFNVSPKLSNSGCAPKLREKPRALAHFSRLEKAFFKFVVAEPSDLEEVLFLQKTYKIEPFRLFLMPEGRSPEVLRSRREWLIEACKRHDFNFSDRLHVQIWGAKKGV